MLAIASGVLPTEHPMPPTRYELDTVPVPLHRTTAGVSALLPGVVAPLTWTSAGAAVEYALRITCCSTLALLPWPLPGRDWAMSGLVEGRAVVDADVAAQAARRVTEHPRRVSLRATRARRSAERSGEAALSYATSLRNRRVGQVMADRTVDDLLLTSSRLLDLVFRALADHTGATLARAVTEGEFRSGEDVGAGLDIGRPLGLWFVPATTESRGGPPGPGPAGDAVAIAAAELRATVDELGRRWSDTRALDGPDDVGFLRWEELPEVAGGRIDALECHSRVSRRKAECAACSTDAVS